MNTTNFTKEELSTILQIITSDLTILESSNGHKDLKMDEDEFYDKLRLNKSIINKINEFKPTTSTKAYKLDEFRKVAREQNEKFQQDLKNIKQEYQQQSSSTFFNQITTNNPFQSVNHTRPNNDGTTLIEGRYPMSNQLIENLQISMLKCVNDAPTLVRVNLITDRISDEFTRYSNTLKFPQSLTIPDIQRINELQRLYLSAEEKYRNFNHDEDYD